jgi:histidyl-tRNA synthetase
VVRAYVQHHPTPPWKVWYLAPHFRYERPQKGRYRQHWQVGAEVLGVDDPDVDVEIIALAHGFYRDLGLRRVSLLLNSMGTTEDRAEFVRVLRAYLLEHGRDLGPEFLARADTHPLRLLDSKAEAWQDVIERAPQLTEHLSPASLRHFEHVQHGLDALGIRYELSPRLVRGFDYYTATTFEFTSDALDAAQNAIGGGGRYDQLAEEMGGPPPPGSGLASVSSGSSSPATPRTSSPPRRAASTRSSSTPSASATPPRTRPSSSPRSARRASGPTARTVAAP